MSKPQQAVPQPQGLATKLDQVDEYLHLQSEVRDKLRKGFMHLASAKYVLGADRVSRFSYDRRMQATAFCPDQSAEPILPTTTLRRRNDSDSEDEEPEAVVLPPNDPLLQFAGFPPKALRDAQEEFRNALKAMLEMHSLAIVNE
ncbi:hypothetical protein HDU98_004254 [Podochytrium sp. JEL0797]|nr:hypothetical protein HDU98_004254 [Podochytrium sp. JEL0797]